MILYHFTSMLHLVPIMDDGYLKTTETNLDPRIEHHGPDAVWFIDTPELGEYDHGLNAALPGEVRPDKTAVRFTIEVPDNWVVQWLPWAEAQGINPHWLEVLVRDSGGREGASHWMCVFRKVPMDRWLNIETRQPDGSWKELGPDTLKHMAEAWDLMLNGHYTTKAG
jgi:hypothetical protein